MKVIITKYHPPTAYRPARMSATVADHGGTIKRMQETIGHFHTDDSHARIAKQLRNKRGWTGAMVGGSLPDGSRVWVFIADKRIKAWR